MSVIGSERTGIAGFAADVDGLAVHVEDVAAARATLEARGVAFAGDVFYTGRWPMAFFAGRDGNGPMLCHRCAPRTTEVQR